MIDFLLLFFLASPFIYMYLKKRLLAWINGFVLVAYFFSWMNVLQYKGMPFVLNVDQVIWLILFISALMFLFVGIAMLFYTISPRVNRFLIPIIIVAVSCIGLFLAFIVFKTTSPLDILWFYITPLYVGAFFVIGLIQYDRQVR